MTSSDVPTEPPESLTTANTSKVGDLDTPPDESVQPVTAQQLQQLAMRGSIWTAVHAVTAVPVAFVANAIVARSLGVADYGSLALLTIAFGIAVQVANAGFSESLVREGAAVEARGDKARTDSLLSRSLGFHVLVEFPVLSAVSVYLAKDESSLVLAALLVSSAMTCVFGGAALFTTLANRSAASAKLAMVGNVVVQLSVATVAVLTASPIAVVAARMLAGALMVPLMFLAVPRDRRRALLTLRLPKGMPSGFWKFSGQSFLAGLIGLLVFSRSEILLLGWLSTPEATGLFALAFGLSIQITAPVDAMLNPMSPAVTGIMSTRPDLARRTLLRATRFSSMLCALIIGVLMPVVFFAVPWVYGTDFATAASLLIPLVVISCIQSMGQVATSFAIARQHGARLLRVNTVALAVNVAAGVPLILWAGLWGAVAANIAGQLASVLLLMAGELRLQGIRWLLYVATIRIWFLGSLTGLGTVGLVSWVLGTTDDYLQCAAAGVVGFAALVVVGRITRSGLEGGDRDAMIEACPWRTRRLARHVTALFVHPRANM